MSARAHDRAAVNPRSILALASSAMILVAAVLAPGKQSAGTDEIVELGGPMIGHASELDDGFRHWVVEVAADSGASTEVVELAVPVVDGRADADVLAALAASGRILALERDAETGVLTATVERETHRSSSDPDAVVARLTAVPGTEDVVIVGGNWYAVRSSVGAAHYEKVEGVVRVVEDVPLTVFGDPLLDEQWHVPVVGAPTAWPVATGADVVVAVVDSGMQTTHPDLVDRVWTNDGERCGNGVDDDGNGFVDDCAGWDFLNDDPEVNDSGTSVYGGAIDNTHATHVAGIVAATRDNGVGGVGVAPSATVMPLKVSDARSMSMSTVARAIRYAVDNGADVVNASFGTNPGTPLAAVAPMQDAIRHAAAHGVVVVAAAGNSGLDIDLSPTYPASFPEPNIIAVGASTPDDERASFSNWGRVSVDLFAPGTRIVSTIPDGYGALDGTSMATPAVAGAVAVLRSHDPSLDVAMLKQLLLTGSDPVLALGALSVSGQRLDIGRIVNPGGGPEGPDTNVVFHDLAGRRTGDPVAGSVVVDLSDPEAAAGGSVVVRALLLTERAGAVYGVTGAAIETDDGTAYTDADASVLLTPATGIARSALDGSTLRAGLGLPAGTYGLVIETTDAATGHPVGSFWAAFFTVAVAAQDAPVTVVPVAPTEPLPPTEPPRPVSQPDEPDPTIVPEPGEALPSLPTPSPGPTSDPTPSPAPAPLPELIEPDPGGWFPDWERWISENFPVPDDGLPDDGTVVPPPESFLEPVPGPAPAPSTTVPLPAPTPTTVVEGPSAPVIAPIEPVRDRGLRVTAVSPRIGSYTGGTRVWVLGSGFAPTMHVLFDGVPGRDVLVLGPNMLLVTSPAHAALGAVDLEVSGPTESVVVENGFVYVDDSSGAGPGKLPPSEPTPTTAPVVDGSDPVPAPQPTTTLPAESAPTSTTTTTAPTPSGPLGFRFGDIEAERDGLGLRPLLPPSPLDPYPSHEWGVRMCTTARCLGTTLFREAQ